MFHTDLNSVGHSNFNFDWNKFFTRSHSCFTCISLEISAARPIHNLKSEMYQNLPLHSALVSLLIVSSCTLQILKLKHQTSLWIIMLHSIHLLEISSSGKENNINLWKSKIIFQVVLGKNINSTVCLSCTGSSA